MEKYLANHYERYPVNIVRGEGSILWDENGKQYFDMLACYGAQNFGHGNRNIFGAMMNQFGKIGPISGNFNNDTVSKFAERLVNFTGLPQAKVLLMNTGAEAVEKAIKLCRRWGYQVKGIRPNQADIIISDTNFHGRTYGVLSASRVQKYREAFGPFMGGFKFTKFGDADDLEHVIDSNTAAFLVEPIQGEGGFIFPPDDYLKRAEEICLANNVLFVLDEIPTAFGRIGNLFPHFHYGVFPDIVILGKALGGGIYPVSAVVVRSEIMDLLKPGDDGSTFGGNPLAAAVGLVAITLTEEEYLADKAKTVGAYFIKELHGIKSEMIKEVRGLGFFIGVELNEAFKAKDVCLQMVKNGIITAPARGNVVRLTPPLIITKGEIELVLDLVYAALRDFKG